LCGICAWDKSGRHLKNIVTLEQPANLNGGDRDSGTLYISATTSVYRLRSRSHGLLPYLPFPGSTGPAVTDAMMQRISCDWSFVCPAAGLPQSGQ
jgi:hypothetical protein